MRSLVRLTDRAVLRVAGEGSTKFLQGLCTQDAASLIPASRSCAAPAAFLSPKGRVLCDVILVARESSEILLDCHVAVAKSLLRLMIRHRLREPLTIDDLSASHKVVASLPQAAGASSSGDDGTADGFFDDPRFAALGQRGILSADAADAMAPEAAESLQAYHFWRLCCGVPEGPSDLPVDSALPLHANLDLLNFISFTKGCYIGQELTARTKHRGAVRKRFFTVAATGDKDPQGFLDGLALARELPLPAAPCADAAGADGSTNLPGVPALGGDAPSDDARTVSALRPGAADWKTCGTLHSVVGNVGLCLLRCDGSFNHPESFREQVALPEGTKLATAGGLPLGLRTPPYAFAE